MYTGIASKRLDRALLIGFALFIFAGLYFFGAPSTFGAGLRWAGSAATAYILLVTVLVGSPGQCAPWRWVYRQIPALNKWLYPDLNGVWLGHTDSNWPVIERTRVAASAGTPLDLATLATVPLLRGDIAIEIKASMFRISLRSKVMQTNGESFSISSRAEKLPDDGGFLLSYMYRQNTPQPVATDEGTHEGAAILKIALGQPTTLQGVYWTRRKWREGMNTGGQIDVRRVSDTHAPEGKDLLQYAKSLSA